MFTVIYKDARLLKSHYLPIKLSNFVQTKILMKSNFHCSIQKEVCHIMKVFHSPINQGLKEGCKFLNHAAFQAIKTKASIFLITHLRKI